MPLSFAPNLKLIAPPRFTASFGQFFVGNMRVFQILPHKNRRRLYILAFKFKAKGVITGGQGEKKGCATAGQRIKYSKSLIILLTISSSKDSHIEQNACKDFVR